MATLKQGIQDFYRVAQQRDFSRDFQFRVMDIAYLGASILTQDDLVYARTGKLPDREIPAQDVPYMGLNFNVPGSVRYPGNSDYEIEFYADQEQTVRGDLYTWSTTVFNDVTSNGNYGIDDSSRITLALLDMTGNINQTFILHGVYVRKIGEVSYDMTGDGKAVVLPVTFAYQFWTPGTQANSASASVSVSTTLGQ